MAEKTAKTTEATDAKTTKATDAKTTKATDAKTTEPVEKKAATPKIEIIRGRMPLPIVHMIKFGTEGETDGAVATKFRTTNGKVSDVRKDRNFAYVGQGMKFSQSMIDVAVAYAEQLDDKGVLKAVKAIKADEDADASVKEARAAARPAKKGAGKLAEAPEVKPAEKVSDKELDALSA